MKKFILPIFILFISFLVLPIFAYPANAQPKSITCEEWIELVLTKKCEFYAAASKGKDQTTDFDIWCLTGPGTCSEEGCTTDFEIKSRPPDYLAEFDWEKCGVVEEGVKSPAVSVDEIVQPEASRKQLGAQGRTLFDVFGINPYQAWLRLLETMQVSEFIASGGLETATEKFFTQISGKKTIAEKDAQQIKAREDSYRRAFGENWQEAIYRQPALTPKVEQDAWKVKPPTGGKVTDVAGVSNTKRYFWDTDSGAVINTSSWENVEFKEPVVDDQEITRTVKFKGPGEVEVKVKNTDPIQNKVKVETDFFDLFVIQTHFWINQDTDKKIAVVGVYEGEVEIRSKDGKTIRIKPEGNKPGTVVISKKLSIAKLAIVSVIAVASIGGLVWFIKKKIVKQSRRRP